MRIAGVVLAGGQPPRVGPDKTAASHHRRTHLDLSILALHPHCALILVAGRFHPARPLVADRPGRGFGPLGGLAGAMQRARKLGFSHLLSLPSDPPFPSGDVLEALCRGPAGGYISDCPVIGLWPTELGEALELYLAEGGPKTVEAWAEHVGIAPLRNTGTFPTSTAPPSLPPHD
jgi:molybdopterin-guanine dinucleotide biosynthesis protein A